MWPMASDRAQRRVTSRGEGRRIGMMVSDEDEAGEGEEWREGVTGGRLVYWFTCLSGMVIVGTCALLMFVWLLLVLLGYDVHPDDLGLVHFLVAMGVLLLGAWLFQRWRLR